MFQLTLRTPTVLPCFPFKNNFNTIVIAKKKFKVQIYWNRELGKL